jgi:hypothetical protein
MNKSFKKVIITKKGTSSNYTTSELNNSTSDNYTNDSHDDSYDQFSETDNTFTEDTSNVKKISLKKNASKKKSKSKSKSKKSPKGPKFTSIVTSTYKKPKKGTIQENYRKEDIIKHLNGFIPLKTMEEKKILTQLPIFKTWIKYINIDTKQFRIGGFLMKVQYPDYIMLANTRTNVTWSVQLHNTIIYIRDPRLKEQETTIDETGEYYDTDTYYTDTYTETQTTNNDVDIIKDKLYKLYLKGLLTTKK